jgi:hypothetical protein
MNFVSEYALANVGWVSQDAQVYLIKRAINTTYVLKKYIGICTIDLFCIKYSVYIHILFPYLVIVSTLRVVPKSAKPNMYYHGRYLGQVLRVPVPGKY